jgi:hypothetical protein
MPHDLRGLRSQIRHRLLGLFNASGSRQLRGRMPTFVVFFGNG